MCRVCGCEHQHSHPRGHDHAHAHAHVHAHGHLVRGDGGDGELEYQRRVVIEASLLAKNDRLALELRGRLARDAIAAFNLIGAPGAGKTTLLEHTIRSLTDVPIAVIEGDQATDRDAQRIAATGCRVVQVNTGPGCHLDASMIERGLAVVAPPASSLLMIENVGNLVCPALFDLGERAKVVVMSVAEGEDKPLKYPHVFRAAAALVVTKVDLLPHVGVDLGALVEHARRVQPAIEVFAVSAPRGQGLAEWCGWLRGHLGGAP